MVRVDKLDGGTSHASSVEWLAEAREGGVPFAEQVEKMPRNRVTASTAIYVRTFATKDAALAIACGSPSLRRKFITAVGHDGSRARQASCPTSTRTTPRSSAPWTATMASRTTAEWKAILDAAGVPASGVTLPVEIIDDEQPAANAMFHRFDHPTAGPVTVLGPAVHLDDGGFAPGPHTAAFGSETRAILEWAGFADRDVQRLLAGGALTPTSA